MSKINKDVRLNVVDYEVRNLEEGNDKSYISGYALKFDKPSEDLGFTEYINRDALSGTNMDNVVALLNHDSNYVLGRTGRNLTLSVDDIGLRFELEPIDTSYTRDLIENMRSGLIDKCSFAFTIPEGGDEWRKIDNDRYERTIKKIDRLYDVSVVTTPAYEDTEAMLSERSINSKKAFEKEMNVDNESTNREREVEVLELELNI